MSNMIDVLLKEKEAAQYFSYLEDSLTKTLQDSNQLGFAPILNQYFLEIRKLGRDLNKNSDINGASLSIELPKYSSDNKTKKYFDWVEILRLIKFQYSRYSNKSVSYTESTYSSIPLLITKLFKARDSKIKALDVGCGPGRILMELSGLYPKSSFYGMDYSLPLIYFAKEIITGKKQLLFPDRKMNNFNQLVEKDYEIMTIDGFNRNNVRFGVADMSEKFRFEDDTFDLVTAINSVNLSRDPDFSVNEIIRVTKEKGIIVLADLLGWKIDREPKRRIFADGASFYSFFKQRKDIEIVDYFYGGPYCEEYNKERMDIFTQHIICFRKKN